MVEDIYLTAPDGPIMADVRLNHGRAWLILALGAVAIAVGGLLLGSIDQDRSAQAGSVASSQP